MGMYGHLRRVTPEFLNRFLDGDEAARSEFGIPGPDDLDLDKDWNALAYLISGKTPRKPLLWTVCGCHPCPLDPTDPDTTQYLTPKEVRRVAKALGRLDEGEVMERYEPKTLDALRIYPGFWERNDVDGELGRTVRRRLRELQMFYRIAAERGMAVIAEQA
jgi:hypothetical protein